MQYSKFKNKKISKDKQAIRTLSENFFITKTAYEIPLILFFVILEVSQAPGIQSKAAPAPIV